MTRVQITERGFAAEVRTPPPKLLSGGPGFFVAGVAAVMVALFAGLDGFQQLLLFGAAVSMWGIAARIRIQRRARTARVGFDGTTLVVDAPELNASFGVGELVSAVVVGRRLLLRRADGLVLELAVDPTGDEGLARLVELLGQLVAVSSARADDATARATRAQVRRLRGEEPSP